MNLKILRLTLQSATPMHGNASKLRGFFATSFNEHALLHQHTADKLIYKYPLIQYKMLQGKPLVLGINEGAEVLKEIYDKFDEIKIGESKYTIMERGVTLKSEEFGCSQEILSYRFATPWLALSQENYPKYLEASWEERKDLLRRILMGNILSASKGLGYVATEQIRLELGRCMMRSACSKGQRLQEYEGSLQRTLLYRTLWGWGSLSLEALEPLQG